MRPLLRIILMILAGIAVILICGPLIHACGNWMPVPIGITGYAIHWYGNFSKGTKGNYLSFFGFMLMAAAGFALWLQVQHR